MPDNPLEGLIGTGASLWLFLVVVIVAGGVREELQRAFLLHRFRGDLGQPWMGLLITSLAFGMGHTLQGLDAAIITGTLGAIWGAMYLTRGSALARWSATRSSTAASCCGRSCGDDDPAIYCVQDHDVGAAPQIRDPVGDQFAAARGIRRSRMIGAACSNVVPAVELRALPRVGAPRFPRRSACSPTQIAAPGRPACAGRREPTRAGARR